MADDSTTTSGTGTADLLSSAASATQGMIPGQGQSMTGFGPVPIVQPPPIPRMQVQTPVIPQGTFQSRGEAQRAKKQALFTNIANLVREGSTYIQDKKQRELTMNIQNLMEAQQGRQQAQQALQQNPNDPEAKKALEWNTGIINNLTKDPKIAKQLSKAFNIDLFGDGKNKQENQSLIQAWQQFNQKQQQGDKTALNPTAQRMMAGQPQQMQLNPQAQAQAMAVKAGLQPNAGEILKAQVENFKAFTSAQSTEDKNQALIKAEEIRAKATDARTAALIDNMNKKVFGEVQAAQIAANAKIKIAKMTYDTWTKRIAEIDKVTGMKDIDAQTKTILGTLSKEAQTYTTEIKNRLQDSEKLHAELDKKGTSIWGFKFSAASGADATNLRQQIEYNDTAVQDAQKNLEMVNKKIMNAHAMGLINLPALTEGSSSSESGNEGTKDNPIPPPSDDDKR